ncbi:protein of unknown function [Modestobacter italicus]|uniref:Uncharacterized protein n=1 Tax=Modestobacter italicus (strain DSM 44449 / CECT 9708 / BC 501) TaxID=2732864 RepID=I4F3C5_MODI5|nr:protein of unknown function [Modestobacter marinus]
MSEAAVAADEQDLRRLALSHWSAAARARVVTVTVTSDRAEVTMLVNGDYEYWQYYVHFDGAWHLTVEGNGPTWGWDDPRVIKW